MRPLITHRCCALLVALLLGFMALTLHASTHTQPDQQSCEFCGGHFNPSHAIAPATELPMQSASAVLLTPESPRFTPSRPFVSYRQRAPPAPI